MSVDTLKHTGDFMQEAWIEFEKYRDFRKYARKEFKEETGFGDGKQHNPDILKSMIADAFQEWLGLGKPTL